MEWEARKRDVASSAQIGAFKCWCVWTNASSEVFILRELVTFRNHFRLNSNTPTTEPSRRKAFEWRHIPQTFRLLLEFSQFFFRKRKSTQTTPWVLTEFGIHRKCCWHRFENVILIKSNFQNSICQLSICCRMSWCCHAAMALAKYRFQKNICHWQNVINFMW